MKLVEDQRDEMEELKKKSEELKNGIENFKTLVHWVMSSREVKLSKHQRKVVLKNVSRILAADPKDSREGHSHCARNHLWAN